MNLKIKKYIINSLFVVLNLTMTVFSCIYLNDLEKLVKVIAVLVFLILSISIPSITNRTAYRLLLAASVTLALILIAYMILDYFEILYVFGDFDIIKNFILSTKQWGVLVFLCITILQVVVLPIPSAITILIGVAIYGPFWSFVLSTIGTYIGSIICFMLGRTFGKRLVAWLFGNENIEKYTRFINEKGRGMFIIMLLFPFFPDDLICMMAGISSMSFKYFSFAMIFARPIMIAATAFLGSGKIIPFSDWGIPVWIALFCFAIGAYFAITFFKNKIADKRGKST